MFQTFREPKRRRHCKDRSIGMSRRRFGFIQSTKMIYSFAEVPSRKVNENDHDEMWYTQEDYDRFQQAASAQAQRILDLRLSRARLADDDFYECLGIEKFLSPELMRELSTRKRAHFDAVLSSQRFWNRDVLAYIAESGSDLARKRAREFAMVYTELSKHILYLACAHGFAQIQNKSSSR